MPEILRVVQIRVFKRISPSSVVSLVRFMKLASEINEGRVKAGGQLHGDFVFTMRLERSHFAMLPRKAPRTPAH